MPRIPRLELMHDHVRSIYRTVTGAELPQSEGGDGMEGVPALEEVERRFADLEAITRSLPAVAERVPPFWFMPPLDVIGTERELVVEMGVPGVEPSGVDVELQRGELWVRGARAPQRPVEGQIYFHAEMPRGPFSRVVRLPEPVSGAPRIEVENGIVRIRLARATRSPLPRA